MQLGRPGEIRGLRVWDGYKFGNFSLIISDAGVLGEARHVDLLWPNFQFGLLVSDEVSKTFSQAERKIQGVDDF
jgi:hypothetical protein